MSAKDYSPEELDWLAEITPKVGLLLKVLAKMENGRGVGLVNGIIDGAFSPSKGSILLTPPKCMRSIKKVVTYATVGKYLVAVFMTNRLDDNRILFYDHDHNTFVSHKIGHYAKISTPIATDLGVCVFCKRNSTREQKDVWNVIISRPEISVIQEYGSTPGLTLKRSFDAIHRDEKEKAVSHFVDMCKKGGKHFWDWIDNWSENEDAMFHGWENSNKPFKFYGLEHRLEIHNSSLYAVPL